MAETIKHCPNLRSYTIYKMIEIYRRPRNIPAWGLATFAAHIFLSHEAHLKAQNLASKLQHITFVHRDESNESTSSFWFVHSQRTVGWHETAFHKTWDPRKGISVQELEDLPPEAADCQWRLWVRTRPLPWNRDRLWSARVE